MKNISIIIPAKNEAASIGDVLVKLNKLYPNSEIIVVDDGSTDNTAKIIKKYDAKLITHPYSMGNGAAIKSGARSASGDILITMDADGQHDPEDIQNLIKKLEQGYKMVVGARSYESQAGKRRWLGNQLYNYIASIVVGKKVKDLTSGFRAVSTNHFKKFLYILPNGFSYPTTITMAFFRNGYPVEYVPIKTKRRTGKSHLKMTRDGLKFFLIIFKITTLYAPLKIFFPTSAIFFIAGLCNYAYTYITSDQFTNMSALLFIISIIVFIMGLLSEQITVLIYKDSNE